MTADRDYTQTSDNTAYTAHFVRPNFGYAETSYMLGTLYAMGLKAQKHERKLKIWG